jgi:hypothetical protein
MKSPVFWVVTLFGEGMMFRKNMSPGPSGSKSKSSKKLAEESMLLGSLLGLPSDSDDGGNMFL